jgi:predicted cupin superfamily sugar epimerase
MTFAGGDAAEWIARLGLAPHPEGGWFRETYRASELITADALPARFGGARNLATAVYFLITSEAFSALHRIRSDELWHFYAGAPVTLTLLDADGRGSLAVVRLGCDPAVGALPQVTVPARCVVRRRADGAPRVRAGGLHGCTGVRLQRLRARRSRSAAAALSRAPRRDRAVDPPIVRSVPVRGPRVFGLAV